MVRDEQQRRALRHARRRQGRGVDERHQRGRCRRRWLRRVVEEAHGKDVQSSGHILP
jgi:hypothetical protein